MQHYSVMFVVRQSPGYPEYSMRSYLRPLRRPILFALLALLTVLVQQGALFHELSHGLGHGLASEGRVSDEGGALPAQACEVCAAYAVLGAALPSAAHLPPPAWDLPPPSAAPGAPPAGTALHAYRARAPPPSV
jgi:hypothetical protein